MIVLGTCKLPIMAAGAPMRVGLVLLALTSSAAWAEPVFSPMATDGCISEAFAASPDRSRNAVLDCVGRSAAVCMTMPGGDTTIGMTDCLGAELIYWDARLNAAYAEQLLVALDQDAEVKEVGSVAPSIEESLRTMQRAWMSFRDASCLYEQAQWMGGTGSGPATVACHMHETARQALKLEGAWVQ